MVIDKATLNAQLSYSNSEDFGAAANVAYDLVPGFSGHNEVAYKDDLAVDGGGSWVASSASSAIFDRFSKVV